MCYYVLLCVYYVIIPIYSSCIATKIIYFFVTYLALHNGHVEVQTDCM